jgi:mono/diheme cytochrome c family protein
MQSNVKSVFRFFLISAALLLIVFVFYLFLSPAPQSSGAQYFSQYCASCHGSDGMRSSAQLTKEKLNKIINQGIPGTQMPKFDYLPKQKKEEIIEYLLSIRSQETME